MAYIAPSTNITFFRNTGLSMSHENTLYFASDADKNTYFSNLSNITLITNNSYQRLNRNYVRVQATMSAMYNVDYMRFNNVNFENKAYYAFVTSINYINNLTVEIEYAVDYLMTWMGTFGFRQCYIERQHVTNDGIGVNIAEEGLPVGNYITEANPMIATWTHDNCIAVISRASSEGTVYEQGGIYSGTVITTAASATDLGRFLQQWIENNEGDSVVGITMQPSVFVRNAGSQGTQDSVSLNSVIAKPYTDIDGYTPRNKKLFCYPYKYCTVDNGEGSSIDLMYEYFNTTPDSISSGNMSFTIDGCSYPNGCEVILRPASYKKNSGMEYRLSITHFPQCSFNVDSYEAYLAQKNAYYPQEMALLKGQGAINMKYSTARGGFSGAADKLSKGNWVGGITGGVVGALEGLGVSTMDTMQDQETATFNNMTINEIRPESPSIEHGSPSIDLLFTMGLKGFFLFEKCITRNYAKMLDSYFDMYGYAIRQHGTPNMNARPHWTYVKTIGCDITGNIPAYDRNVIESIFNNGVRFWHNLDEMGNYSLDNSPA